GYVMLMMMRAGGISENTPSPCESPENQVLCMIDSVNCPYECKESEITSLSGILQIDTTSLAIGTLPVGTKYVGSLQLTATDEDIILKTLSFQKVGNFTKGWIEDDGVKIASMQSVSSDTSILATFTPDILIKKGTSKTLSVMIQSDVGGNQGVTLSNTQNIQSSANTIQGVFPLRLVK
ncbi:MAG TPA: hypothetical protein PKC87_03715, partial [Candidatus Absconditabacterales bacterium]|nr:hypothetical protein [Candidatus Absconditabacterales bacterium]